MRGHLRATPAPRWRSVVGCALATLLLAGCTTKGGVEERRSLRVTVLSVGGGDPPGQNNPMPANLGDREETWTFGVEALDANGQLDGGFNGYVRISVAPGSVLRVEGPTAHGRNVQLVGGYTEGTAVVTAMFGPSRLRADDLGYQPAAAGETALCANGIDDDGDIGVDHPNDPGCAFADDMTEEGGSYVVGVSPTVYYELPSLSDVQGLGSATPYPYTALQTNTADPRYVVVTRVASSGFFVTDVTDETLGYNHIYAYNFNTPWGMRVCDQVTYLAGTASEFYGYTELSFPSYAVNYHRANGQLFGPEDCRVPEPFLVDAAALADPVVMERHESGLVRVEGFTIASMLGPGLVVNNSFTPEATNCDLNQDGTIDYEDAAEGSCSNACTDDPDCSEWNSWEARGNYKVRNGAAQVLINTSTAFGFDPLAHKGETLPSVTGTLRNFSGGDLNWTIETRCIDDLVCGSSPCPAEPVAMNVACVTYRTQQDDDEEGGL